MRESPPPLPRGTPRAAEGLPISWKLHEIRPPPPPKPQSLLVFQESFKSYASQSMTDSGFRKKSPKRRPERPEDEKGSPPAEKEAQRALRQAAPARWVYKASGSRREARGT